MRLLITIISVLLFLSCTTKENYYGEWYLDYRYDSFNNVDKVTINKDSIIFEKLYPRFRKSFKFSLNDTVFKFKIVKDTLVINDALFVRNYPDTIIDEYYMTSKVSLGLKNEIKRKNPEPFKRKNCFSNIGFDDFKILKAEINDLVFPISDYPENYVFSCIYPNVRHELPSNMVLMVDHSVKMIDIEKVFLKFQLLNVSKNVYILNESFFNENDVNFAQDYYKFRFIPLKINENYYESVFGESREISIPPGYYLGKEENKEIKNISTLAIIDNEYYFNGEKFNLTALKSLVEKKIKSKETFIVTYNHNSNLEHFLALNVSLENIFIHLRNRKSKEWFNKTYLELFVNNEREKIDILKMEFPMILINGYSLEHLNYFKETEGSLYGISLETIPELN